MLEDSTAGQASSATQVWDVAAHQDSIGRIPGWRDFLDKATTYQLYFNLGRKNSGKENKTPWRLVQEKLSQDKPPKPRAHPLRGPKGLALGSYHRNGLFVCGRRGD